MATTANPASSSYALREPVEKLPGLVDDVLIQIGKVFRHSARKDIKALNNDKSTIRQLIPKANRQFHEALDEIEIELLKAKSVMELDLAAIRTKRAERERAANASRIAASLSSEEQAKSVLANADPAAGAEIPDLSQEAILEDAVMIDDLSKASNVIPASEVGQEKPSELENPSNSTAEQPAKADDSVPPAVNQQSQQPQDQKFSPQPGDSTNLDPVSDADFDSMFNDPAPGTDDGINFDLDFSTDAHTSQDMLSGNSFGDLTSTGDSFAAINASSNEDINTLLPGLENYVSADAGGEDDFSMLDIPTGGPETNANNQTTTTGQTMDATFAEVGDTAPVTSTFDDLFFAGDGDMGMDGEMGADGELGEFADFDDDWFKTD